MLSSIYIIGAGAHYLIGVIIQISLIRFFTV